MNIIPLTAIVITAALTSNLAASQAEPCANWDNSGRYEEFVKNHILTDNSLDEGSTLSEWTTYLKDKKLLGRALWQSFIKATEKTVQQICGDSGRHLRGDLCISKSPMVIYHVQSTKDKATKATKVTKVTKGEHNVIVGCKLIDKTGKDCRPVHYEAYRGERPGNLPCKSGP